MFGKEKLETEGEVEAGGRKLALASCAQTRCMALVGRTLVVAFAGGPNMPVSAQSIPLPLFGRPVAIGDGPSVLMANGDLFYWDGDRWDRQYNLHEVAARPA